MKKLYTDLGINPKTEKNSLSFRLRLLRKFPRCRFPMHQKFESSIDFWRKLLSLMKAEYPDYFGETVHTSELPKINIKYQFGASAREVGVVTYKDDTFFKKRVLPLYSPNYNQISSEYLLDKTIYNDEKEESFVRSKITRTDTTEVDTIYGPSSLPILSGIFTSITDFHTELDYLSKYMKFQNQTLASLASILWSTLFNKESESYDGALAEDRSKSVKYMELYRTYVLQIINIYSLDLLKAQHKLKAGYDTNIEPLIKLTPTTVSIKYIQKTIEDNLYPVLLAHDPAIFTSALSDSIIKHDKQVVELTHSKATQLIKELNS